MVTIGPLIVVGGEGFSQGAHRKPGTRGETERAGHYVCQSEQARWAAEQYIHRT
jgi:hypothetical protein